MAFTSIQGQVTRVFYQGKGAEITESFEIKGKEIKKRWTAWFDEPHGLTEGDDVEVSGLHGDEVDEWVKDGDTRHSVKRSLNKARIKPSKGTGGQQGAQDDDQGLVDRFDYSGAQSAENTNEYSNSETPF